MLFSAPGSPKLRELVEQFIEEYRSGICWETPEERYADATQKILIRLAELRADKDMIFSFGPNAVPRTRADITTEECKLLQVLLAIAPNLIYIQVIEQWAVESGAIPDPHKNWKLYRLPEGGHACWECGRHVHEEKRDPEATCTSCADIIPVSSKPAYARQEKLSILKGSTC